MKEADAAIIDAPLIESAARPGTHVEAPPEDRAKNEAPDEPAPVIFSADNDARWVKKGRKGTLVV
jgi:transposase, IS5 family